MTSTIRTEYYHNCKNLPAHISIRASSQKEGWKLLSSFFKIDNIEFCPICGVNLERKAFSNEA